VLKDKDKFSSEAVLGLKKCESRKVASTVQLFALQYGEHFILLYKHSPTPGAARAVWFFF